MSKSSRKKPSQSGKPVMPASKVILGTSEESVSLSPSGEVTALSKTFEPISELIRFDKRVKWTLGVFLGLFLSMVLLKWHYVSIPIWNRLVPDGSPENRGLIAGTPRQIRMDDYAVATPWGMSNANNGYPIKNESIGGLNAALLATPAKHLVTIFKFPAWGYMFLDLERAFSWGFLSGPFILLTCGFLFFLLVLKNQFWLSLTATLSLLLSSGTVSWSFIPSGATGYCCGAFVAAVYLIRTQRPIVAVVSSVSLIWLVVSYILNLYPPYQVPLSYLFAFLLIGYLVTERQALLPVKLIPLKLVSLLGATFIAGIVVYIFRQDVQDTIIAVTSTVYPGKRSETGGTGFISNWYSEYYSWFFSDSKFPKSWLNVCEMAHYLNFAPTIIPFSLLLFTLTKRVDWMIVMASLFVLLMLVWMEVGYPKSVATATLMSMSPTRRTQIPMGIGGIILLFLYLGHLRWVTVKAPAWVTPVGVLLSVCFVVYTAYININDSDGLIRTYQTFIPVVFFTFMNVLLLFSVNIPYRIPIFCAGIFLFLLPNIKVNPLSIGLSPITEHALYKAIRPLVQQDPQARWMVNGNQFITYLVTATGAKQITGVKYIPDREHIFKVLDPKMKRDSAYNRYAHVTYQSYIDGKDSVILANQFEDGYVIAMDPCSPKMKQLNVKYQVFDHKPQPVEIRCMKEVVNLGSLTIYQANL